MVSNCLSPDRISHLPNSALVDMRAYGYHDIKSIHEGTGLLNVRHPYFCIFCLYDASLPADFQIVVYNELTGKAY